MSIQYLQLPPESTPPDISSLKPFRAVLIIDTGCSTTWQTLVSEWLVRSGCLYAMTWGIDCSSWHDSVDLANVDKFDYNDIPEEEFIMTTWHAKEPLSEIFWFSKNLAYHSLIELPHTLLLHISSENQEGEILRAYAAA
jgi:hypothetical protein